MVRHCRPDITAIEGHFESDDTILVVHDVHDAHDVHDVLAIATALTNSDQRENWPASGPVLRYRRVLIQ